MEQSTARKAAKNDKKLMLLLLGEFKDWFQIKTKITVSLTT